MDPRRERLGYKKRAAWSLARAVGYDGAMGLLPIRFRDGSWQVEVADRETSHWVRCDSESDGYQLAASANLLFAALDGDRVGEGIARELESCATLFTKYGCHSNASHLKECAKFARGEPSDFDGRVLD
jgi:hypothetical protein